jgi:nucleotide-binding universal stress UspA family protein
MYPIAKILLPVDFSARASHAARFAIPVAEHFHSEMILLHVLPPVYAFSSVEMGGAILANFNEERRKSADQRLAGFLTEELSRFPVRRLLLEGDPAHEIVACARREQVGLIMMPTHGYGPFRRLLLGSVTAKVLHDADVPVWTAAHIETLDQSEVQLHRIVCALDLGPTSGRVLKGAADLAGEFGAELNLVHALRELDPRTEKFGFSPEWRRFLEESAEKQIAALQQTVGTRAAAILALGPPAEMVCAEARKVGADLLVIGRGAESILGRLSSAAYAIIRQAPCPVASV